MENEMGVLSGKDDSVDIRIPCSWSDMDRDIDVESVLDQRRFPNS
jgi:hypothetical protein